MKVDYEDKRKLARWCASAGLTPLEALTRLWLILDEHREFIDDVGPQAKDRIGRVEEFALDCRKAYWQQFESSQDATNWRRKR